MKKITFLFIIVVANIMASFASDPGGMPGLVKATFKGSSFDSTSDVMANVQGCVVSPEEMYATSLPEKTTVAWAGYMKMEGGVTYEFKGCYDDFVTVKIAGTWVLSKGSECQERTGSYTPATTDWYSIEFRVANNGGGGGCQNTSQYGILWKKSADNEWCSIKLYDAEGELLFKTGRSDIKLIQTDPIILSCQVRKNDPTILDVKYIVYSQNPTVNVRALAFQDGERSFFKVVRPETFVKDSNGNETAKNIGDNIPANVEHTLSWKVSADWATDLAKVKFEVLVSDVGQLPLKTQTIPPTLKNPFALKVAYNDQNDNDMFNALFWWYADNDPTLVNNDGYIDVGGVRWVNRTEINADARMMIQAWLYEKMGWEPLMGGNLITYARKVLRKELWHNTGKRNSAILKKMRPVNLYLGEKAYMVIDISGGMAADSYSISYLDTEPLEGWGEEYKTSKILLRRIEAGKFMFQGNKEVTLTKPFYIGVFELTQKQYYNVMGNNPSQYVGDTRPVERVSYSMAQEFWKKVNERTDLEFNFPTEAQWEYACRAGTDSLYNNGGFVGQNKDINLDLRTLGRYATNQGDGRGGYSQHTIVGSYEPNAWGLYDMHGNIAEWCLDWCLDLNADPAVDFISQGNGIDRVIRGGCWCWCNSHDDTWFGQSLNGSIYRHKSAPSSVRNEIGFRICLTEVE